MTAGYNFISAGSHLSLGAADVGCGINEGTSSTSTSVPLSNSETCEKAYSENINTYNPYKFPIHDPVSATAMGLIPVNVTPIESDIAGFYKTRERGRKNSRDGNDIPPNVLSRRRAQNRASQRAYRNRKDEKEREIEAKLADLRQQHQTLTQSYKTLELEYSAMKEELKGLQSQHESTSPIIRNLPSCLTEWDDSWGQSADPLLSDASVFSYDAEGDQNSEARF